MLEEIYFVLRKFSDLLSLVVVVKAVTSIVELRCIGAELHSPWK